MRRLAALMNLGRENDRGRPLSPIQQVCVALNFYGGGHYTRVAGLCGGVSQNDPDLLYIWNAGPDPRASKLTKVNK